MKVYHIHREGDWKDRKEVVVRVQEQKEGNTSLYVLSPEASLKQRAHSPDGFNFGYGGSGPAQLALAILMDFTGKVPHPALYQLFKMDFIASIDHRSSGGVIYGEAIQKFIDSFKGDWKFMPPGEKP